MPNAQVGAGQSVRCPNCTRVVDPGWSTCPYCKALLRPAAMVAPYGQVPPQVIRATPPATPQTAPPTGAYEEKPRRSSKALPIALVILLGLAGAAVLIWVFLPKGNSGVGPNNAPTPTVVAADIPTSGPVETAAPTTEGGPTDTNPTPQAVDTETPLSPDADAKVRQYQIGSSVLGSALLFTCIDNGKERTISIAGGINGTHANTKALLESLISELSVPGQVPPGRTVCILPALNPDGLASNSSANAHGVDLNRNWLTTNWKSDISDAGGARVSGGGATSFSEPETQAYNQWLRDLDGSSKELIAINYYASTSGQVMPSYRVTDGQQQVFGDAATAAQKFAGALGYTFATNWSEEQTTGEFTNWCGENYFSCFDALLPTTQILSSEEVQQQVSAIKSLLP